MNNGLPARPLFPRAWKYYDGVVTSIGAGLVLLNTLAGSHLFSAALDKWMAFSINLLVAVMIWLNQRRRQLHYERLADPAKQVDTILKEHGDDDGTQ